MMAVQPQGFLDTRWRPEAVPWDAVARVEMQRLETQWRVAIYLWPDGDAGREAGAPDWVGDLADLDVDGPTLAEDIARFVPVHVP